MGSSRLNLRRRNYKKIRDLAMGKRHEKKSLPEVTVESARCKCTICWEGFTTDDHEPCALKSCGHVFGKRCIRKWIGSRLTDPTCPLCKQVIHPTDVLPLYIDFQDDAHMQASLSAKIAGLELREDRLAKAYQTLRRAWPKGREGVEEKGT